MLLDGCGNSPRDTDAITAHFHRMILTLRILIGRIQRFTILRSEIERLSNLDSAVSGKRTRLHNEDTDPQPWLAADLRNASWSRSRPKSSPV